MRIFVCQYYLFLNVMKQIILTVLLLFTPALVFAQSITGTWSTASSTGFKARSDFAAVALNGKIYVIGGRNGNTNDSTMDVYDPSTDTWSTPVTTGTFTPRWGLGAAVVGGKIYVMGGVNSDLQIGMSTLEVFDPSTNTWSTPTTTGALIGRDAFATAVVNGLIYVIGGYSGSTDPNTNQVFDPIANTWTDLSPGSFIARDGLTACAIGDTIYTMAGIVDDFSNTFQVFDPSTNMWSTPTTTGWLTTRSLGASDVIDGKIYVVGGTNDTEHFVGGLQVFDPATTAWSTAITTDTVIPREELGAVAVNGKLYVIGGIKASSLGSVFSIDIQFFTPASSGVSMTPATSGITVWPNPTDGVITVGGMPSGEWSVTIENPLGEKVLNAVDIDNSQLSIDLDALSSGAYYATFKSQDSIVTKLIIKQ